MMTEQGGWGMTMTEQGGDDDDRTGGDDDETRGQ